MGKIMCNQEKQEEIKRKRMEAFKEEFEQDNINDKVWFPPQNINSNDQVPVDKP